MKTWLIKCVQQISYRPLFTSSKDQTVTSREKKEEEVKERAKKESQESGGGNENF